MQRSLRVKSMAFILPGSRTMRRVSYMRARRLMVSVLRFLLAVSSLARSTLSAWYGEIRMESLFKREKT